MPMSRVESNKLVREILFVLKSYDLCSIEKLTVCRHDSHMMIVFQNQFRYTGTTNIIRVQWH